jgi:hypothetical protein
MVRVLAQEVAPGAVEPVEDLDPLEGLDAVEGCVPGWGDLDPAFQGRRGCPGAGRPRGASRACGSCR